MPRTGRPTANLEEKVKVLEERGFDTSMLQPWYRKFHYHQNNATQNGKVTELTFEDYMQKVQDAGITNPEQIGRRESQFQLGRIGDVGPYTNETCRFITKLQNIQESRANNRHDPVKAAAAVDKKAKDFIATAPDGTVHEGRNLSQFCREHDLGRTGMLHVISGKTPTYKGWTVRYPEQDAVSE